MNGDPVTPPGGSSATVVEGVRPFVPSDLPVVVSLIDQYVLHGAIHGGDTRAFLQRTLIDDPWVDPDVPSLVTCDPDGRVVGFIGVQPRRFRLDGRPLRAACVSHFVVAPEARSSGTSMRLMSAVLNGPQDLTYSDSALPVVARMWRVLGGYADHSRGCDWALSVAPLRWTGAVARSAVRQRRLGRDVLPVTSLPFQMAGERLLRRAFPADDTALEVRPAAPEELAEALPGTFRQVRLHAEYDAAYLTQLFGTVALGEAAPRACLVRRGPTVVGAFVYRPAPTTARLLTLTALPGQLEAVLGAMLRDVREQGCGMVTGRLEPHLADALAPRLPALSLARRPILHSHRADVREVFLSERAVISRLDSEWWVT